MYTSLADSLVCNIIELSDEQVVNSLLSVLAHDSEDCSNLLLELDHGLHELLAHIFVSDLANQSLLLIHLLINLLNLLVDLLALVLALVLQLLYKLKDALLLELELGL